MTASPLHILQAIAVNCLLEDQIRSSTKDVANYGSWGESTLDYCFLSTNESSWIPGEGSITQTAWALRGLLAARYIMPEGLGQVHRAICSAEQYIDRYITAFLSNPEEDRTETARYRHAATALLCKLLLDELPSTDHVGEHLAADQFGRYAVLLDDLAAYLLRKADAGQWSPPTEVALLALYPLLVSRLLAERTESNTSVRSSILQSLVAAWRNHAGDVGTSAVRLLNRFDPKSPGVVSSPHVWAAFLDATSTIGKECADAFGFRARELHAEVRSEAVTAIEGLSDRPLPTYYAGSLWEPWGMLALLVQMGSEFRGKAEQVASSLIQTFLHSSLQMTPSVSLGGCTHVWSILARHATDGPLMPADRDTLALASQAAKRLREAGLFGYRHWPRNNQVRISRDSRAIALVEAWIQSGLENRPKMLDRFVSMYRGDLAATAQLQRNQGHPLRSLLLAGYTRAGKSTVADFLERRLQIARTVSRMTTAPWGPGESWEKAYYDVVTEPEFEHRRGEGFGEHQLLGAKFAFLETDYERVPQSMFRLLSVGWSKEGIAGVIRFCRERGDEPLVIVIKPAPVTLEGRIRERWGAEELEERLREASKFYDDLPEGSVVVDSSGSKDGLAAEVLCLLSSAITMKEGWDVVLSYAGPQAEQAERIRLILERRGIHCYSADAVGVLATETETQDGIDRIFETADIIVLLWSSEYPKREFTSYEWRRWLSPMRANNPDRVLLVRLDDTPPPIEFRTASRIDLRSGEANFVASVIERLNRLNKWNE